MILPPGIRFACVTRHLQNEGIQKCMDPFEALLHMLEDKETGVIQRMLERSAGVS
jgi:hypothetical protein